MAVEPTDNEEITLDLPPQKASSFFSSAETYQNLSSCGVLMGKFSRLGYKHGRNEDRACFDAFEYAGLVYTFAAVFDGHGGCRCSEWLSNNVGEYLRTAFGKPDSWEHGEEVLREVFHQIDRDWCQLAYKYQDTSGACATIAIAREDEIIIGNIGDCRAVMVPLGGKGYLDPVEITVDHRADAPAEEFRLNNEGFMVENGRIFCMQPSRSFGDIDVKELAGKAAAVIASPDMDRVFIRRPTVKSKRRQSKLDRSRTFLMIGTDGVWDTVDNKLAANTVKNILRQKNSASFLEVFSFSRGRKNSKSSFDQQSDESGANVAELAAEKLVNLALERGSDDDITAVVMMF